MWKIIKLTVTSIIAVLWLSVLTSAHVTHNTWALPGQEFLIHAEDEWFSCSVGFPAVDHAGNRYFITAGHCFRSDDLRTHYTRDPQHGVYVYSPNDEDNPVGFERGWTAINVDNTYLDISLVEMFTGKRILGNGWKNIPHNIVFHPTIGEKACLVGFKQSHDTKGNCGGIIETNRTAKDAGSMYSWSVYDRTTYCSHPGDSGGAVYSDTGILGVNVAGNMSRNEFKNHLHIECRSGFVPINEVLNFVHTIIPDLTLL